MNKQTLSESRKQIFDKMMAFWGGETNTPAITAISQSKMMRASFRAFLSEINLVPKEKQIFEMVNEVSFELMPMAGRLSGFSEGLAAIQIAAQEGLDGQNKSDEVLGAIIDFIDELNNYNVGTLQLGRNCSKNLHSIGEKLLPSK